MTEGTLIYRVREPQVMEKQFTRSIEGQIVSVETVEAKCEHKHTIVEDGGYDNFDYLFCLDCKQKVTD